MIEKRIRKNEIYANCQTCKKELCLAYWDSELEYYIYLHDEDECICKECELINLKSQSIRQPMAEPVI